MAKPIGISCVGAGYWGPNLIRNVWDSPDAELVSICDVDGDRLQKIGKRYPAARLVRNFREVLSDEQVQAVIIATPASSHAELGVAALAAGKDVLVEKPLAHSVEECRRLVRAADQHDRVLMVGHTFVFNAAVRKIRSLVEDGELGEVLYVYSSRVNLGRIRRDVNALWNVAPHDVSIVNHVLGASPERVRATGRAFLQPDIEDVVFAVFEYPGGTLAHIHSSWLDPSKVRRTTFVGSRKMIVYDDVESEGKVKIYDKGVRRATPDLEYGEFQLRLHSGDIHIPKITFTEPLADELAHFVDCVRTRKRPLTDGIAGISIVAALEAAQKSIRADGEAVDIEPAA